jgi:NAD(P)H-flavin reductase/ferredoxin
MHTLTFNGQKLAVLDNETVLDTLLRNNIAIAYGCRAGACQACMLMAKTDQIPDDCQHGLSKPRIQEGYFLSCRCEPEQDMEIQLPNLSAEKQLATISEKSLLNPTTLRLNLQCRFRWRAGQYITLWLNDTARCYSIASVASLDKTIELHIHIYPSGAVSQSLATKINVGDTLAIQGPIGECVYDNKQGPQNLLLIASGTGLAPLLGLARDALSQNHQNSIHLLFRAKHASDFYCVDTLQTLQAQYPQFSFSLNCDEPASSEEDSHTNTWQAYLRRHFTELRGSRVYICGGDDFVQQARKQCFMQGAARRDIICEAFINFSPEN